MRKKENILIENAITGGDNIFKKIDKIPDIIKKIEDNVGLEVMRNNKIQFKTRGMKKYLMVNTKQGVRQFRSLEMTKGARLLILILCENSREIDKLFHGKQEKSYPDLTQKGEKRK